MGTTRQRHAGAIAARGERDETLNLSLRTAAALAAEQNASGYRERHAALAVYPTASPSINSPTAGPAV